MFRARAARTVLLASTPRARHLALQGFHQHLASVSRARPAIERAAQQKFVAALRAVSHGLAVLHRQHLETHPARHDHFHLQAAQLQAFAADRQQTLEKAQIDEQRLPVVLGLSQLLGQALLGGALGGEQALGGVRYLARLGVRFLQLHHLLTQALQFLLRALVQTGDALAELEPPQRQHGRKTQRQRSEHAAQRSGQGSRLRTIALAAPTESRRRRGFQQISQRGSSE